MPLVIPKSVLRLGMTHSVGVRLRVALPVARVCDAMVLAHAGSHSMRAPAVSVAWLRAINCSVTESVLFDACGRSTTEVWKATSSLQSARVYGWPAIAPLLALKLVQIQKTKRRNWALLWQLLAEFRAMRSVLFLPDELSVGWAWLHLEATIPGVTDFTAAGTGSQSSVHPGSG